jgi:amphi-Trp domain-containing protein
MDLIEHTTEERLGREEAAQRLRMLADELARQNELSFTRGGMQFRVAVPDNVLFSLEVEVGDGESEIEIELKW